MEPYNKGKSEAHELVVVSSLGERDSYFLRNCGTMGFPSQLDFRWMKKGKIKASLTLAISDNYEAISLPQSPFGGIWTEENISSVSLEGFIQAVIIELRQRRISSIKIIQPPKPYESNFDLINYLLFKLGFKQVSILSHQFFIGKKKIKRLVQNEGAKYLAKSKELGLKIRMGSIQNFGFLQEIKTWNQARGYAILFDETRLISQVSDFPERYFLISIYKEGIAMAHALGVKLQPDSIYYFLSGTLPKANIKNLGEMCLFQLFQLASDQKLNFVDLGSSDLDSEVNHSLIFFKSRFSNDISNKVTWTLNL
ncbi:hypothetical protein [Algoriphagus boritolerans]|uniref:Acetyltransferase (GNAT) domain-containing protein n=1 Tax=Algoriphagus boritolerans DSM 17298 = JCM 18970 TaxID=1120964 RepID=A0A1H5X8I5_9BACT|nr:hypothetical protein [Algoriphagus boritolerans]SEG07566.1 hypothetical protein SAMN03080598_02398 [Algoriphagus boritolerans DSM 17298 = JCM 18970]